MIQITVLLKIKRKLTHPILTPCGQIILICLMFFSFTAQAEYKTCPDASLIDKERSDFKKLYKNQQYKTAIDHMSVFVEEFSNTSICYKIRNACSLCELDRNEKNKLLWAYSDMALAAYKLNDARQCLSKFTTVSDLGYWIFDKPKSKAFQAYKFNIFKCLELPNVENTIIGNQCEQKFDNCFYLKQLVTYKVASKYKQPDKQAKLDLKRFGQSGSIFIKKPKGKHQCPKIYWKNKHKIKELKIKEKFSHSFTDESYCCNLNKNSLALFMKNNKINLQVAYSGTDCFGGSARWFSEEIYEVDLKHAKLIFKSNRDIGFH